MFSIGCLLPRDEIGHVLSRWPTVLGGTALQYTVMPLVAYLAGRAFQLDDDALTGVILVGCVPGAMASNVLTLAARGNVSYSVSLTASATLLSPLVVPFVLWLTLAETRTIDVFGVFRQLLITVVAPVVLGHLVFRDNKNFAKAMRIVGPVVANLAILWIVAVVVGVNRVRLADFLKGAPALMAALLSVNLLGYAAGYYGGQGLRLSSPMRRALTLEVGMQNAGLGTVMAMNFFSESPGVAIPTAVYTFGCMLTGTILAQYWAVRRQVETERES